MAVSQKSSLLDLLQIKFPVVQGPFGGGISTIELATTVSNAGGMGSFGAYQMSPDAILKLCADLRAKTDQAFNINLWVSDHDPGGLDMSAAKFSQYCEIFRPIYEELGLTLPEPPAKHLERYEDQVEALIEARPPVFSFVFGVPSAKILEKCRRAGIITIGTATNVEEAKVLDQAGVDAIVATGFEAGGHRVSFLRQAEQSLFGTLALVPQVVDAVKVPVIAAGGIADRRGLLAAQVLGAQAAQIGTAFLACKESGTTDLHRQQLFSDHARYTKLSRAYTGRLARFIPNAFIENWTGPILPFPLQSWFTAPIKQQASALQNLNHTAHYAGQGAPLLQHRSARDLMESLIEGK